MPFVQRVAAVYFGCISIFSRTALGATTPPSLSILPNAGSSDLILALPHGFNESTLCGSGPQSRSHHGEAVGVDKGTWRISETLSLAIVICNWSPDPATIQAVLAAAALTVGKKPATALLEENFVQKSNNRYNTLYFEIGPGDVVEKRLTWGVVGEVLGEDGLAKFFETTRLWHTVYFGVMHATEGPLGNGAVRRWWQLELPGGNGTLVGDNGGHPGL